jgi:hypothetical protein
VQRVQAIQVVSPERRGSSCPVLIDTPRGRLFTKLRGAAQGPLALVAEIVVAELGERLGLKVPRRTLVEMSSETPSLDRNDELADLLRMSHGVNVGFELLAGARDLKVTELDRVSGDLAAQIVWLDGLVMNPDRTPRNPNLMVRDRDGVWLIDHGAALGFQHDWPRVDEEAPRRRYALEKHLLSAQAAQLREWDELFAQRIDREALRAAVAEVPDELLEAPDAERRRETYVAFLWKRLKAPRPFV